MRELLEGVAASPATLEFRWRERRVRREGDVAWVNAAGTVAVAAPGEPSLELPYRVTAVFLRLGGRWLWHTHSGSAPGPG